MKTFLGQRQLLTKRTISPGLDVFLMKFFKMKFGAKPGLRLRAFLRKHFAADCSPGFTGGQTAQQIWYQVWPPVLRPPPCPDEDILHREVSQVPRQLGYVVLGLLLVLVPEPYQTQPQTFLKKPTLRTLGLEESQILKYQHQDVGDLLNSVLSQVNTDFQEMETSGSDDSVGIDPIEKTALSFMVNETTEVWGGGGFVMFPQVRDAPGDW